MSKINMTLLIVISITIFGCSDNQLENNNAVELSSSCTNISEDLVSCDFEQAICSGTDRVFTDDVGDVEKLFVDLKEMIVTLSVDCVAVTWKVEKIPETLTINHTNLKVNANNYSWSAYFDIDMDGLPSKGDLFISMDKDKFEEQAEKIVPVSKLAHGSLVEIQSLGSTGRVDARTKAFIKGYVSNNSLSLYLPIPLHPSLSKINNQTPIDFTAQFNDGLYQYKDNHPDE